MSRSAEMPFSRSSRCTASTISLDIALLALQQVALVNVGVRDPHDPCVGRHGDGVVGGLDQLAAEALGALDRLARAHSHAAPDVAAKVVRLRERTLGPRR